jgi:hypothetical protein
MSEIREMKTEKQHILEEIETDEQRVLVGQLLDMEILKRKKTLVQNRGADDKDSSMMPTEKKKLNILEGTIKSQNSTIPKGLFQ